MLKHMDNWCMYGSNPAFMLNGVYATAQSLALDADPDGISSGRVVRMRSSAFAPPTLRFVLPTSQPDVGTCQRIWMNNLPGAANDRPRVMEWKDALNNRVAYLQLETTGRLLFNDTAGGGATNLETVNPVVTANGWWHIEALYDTAGVGSIEVRVEGQVVLLDADLGYVAKDPIYQVQIDYGGVNLSGTDMYVKDFVVWDTTGALNNDFLGSVIVYDLETELDISLNWVPTGAADGASILINAPPDDAEFITAINPPPAPYTAQMTDLPPDVTSVKGLMTMVRAAKTDGGDAFLQVGIISDPTGVPATALGTDRPITIAQTYWRDVQETDPKTAALWLPSAVNDVYIQLDRTA